MLSKIITVSFFLSLTIFSFAQCKSGKNTALQNKIVTQPNNPMANQNITSKFNSDKSMELYLKKNIRRADPAIHFEYTVYDVKTRKVIKKGTFRGARIEWNDKMSLKLIAYVGMEQKPTSENPEEALLNQSPARITIVKLHK
ncbi:hypothetical protein AWE51_21160 [Aquimarina aggregata]|uniref:Uncharacterized protein n=1 Tax=Aquimarina aggregata TaxID=1642818 RepID=A0A162CV44_9FLAO|nr:hypothetical protein [Aquimarina aggregata]KZS41519.1 hypothetical protein AWE51_21160 [Aquimarina aggregata]